MIAHFVLAGQSNMDQWFHAGNGAALEAFRATFLGLNPGYTDVQFFDAARGGSAMLGGSASAYADVRAPDDADLHERISQNYWYDEAIGAAGPNLILFAGRIEAEVQSGTEFLGVIWAQGEADTTFVGANGAAGYADGFQYVLDQLMHASGAPQVHIQALGDRAFYSEALHGGATAIREAQQEVADSSDAITLATTIFDLELRDSVHLTVDGYEAAATRMAIAISTGETSPSIGDAILIDAHTVLLQLALAPGQSIAGGVAPGSLSLSEGGTDIPIASVTITPTGLLRIETLAELTNPRISYGSVEDSVTMQADEFIYVTGQNGTVPILPFDLLPSPPRQQVIEMSNGLRIEGDAMSEDVTGLSGDDILFGNAGHDTLDGGWGSDSLTGGAGSDIFVLSDDMRVDTVHDFDVTQDAIGLVGMSRDVVTISASGDGDVMLQTSSGQRMILENIALDQADDIRFHMLGTEAANDLVGSSGDNRIFAQGGDDTINSGAGYDRITTGDGADVVAFGSGYGTNIVYDFDIATDTISLVDLSSSALTIRDYKGTDLELRTVGGDRLILRDVSLSESDLVRILDAPPQVGVLTGTDGNDVLRGTELDELIEGLSGTDRLYGGGGNDVFAFREGSGLNVVYDFVDGQDQILVDAAAFNTLTITPYKGTDAEIRLATGERLVLRNVDYTAIDADDFLFTVPEVFA